MATLPRLTRDARLHSLWAPAPGMRGKQKPGTPPGRPASRGATKVGPRERAETNALRWRRRQETLETTTRPRVRAHRSRRGSRSPTEVFVGIGTDDEPSLGVTRDDN